MKFHIRVEQEYQVTESSTYTIEGNTLEEALGNFLNNREQYSAEDTDVQWDSAYELYPEDINGESTMVVVDSNYEVIYDNSEVI